MWPLALCTHYGVFLSLFIFLGVFRWLIFPIYLWKGKNVEDVLLARPGNISSILLPVFTDILLGVCVCVRALVRFFSVGIHEHGRMAFFNFCIISCSLQSFRSLLPVQLIALAEFFVYVCIKRSSFKGKWRKTKHIIYSGWWEWKLLFRCRCACIQLCVVYIETQVM